MLQETARHVKTITGWIVHERTSAVQSPCPINQKRRIITDILSIPLLSNTSKLGISILYLNDFNYLLP